MTHHQFLTPVQRIRVWYAILLLIGGIFIIRLFYLQVIRHDYYQKSALQGQLKEYEIPSTRGIIEAHNGKSIVPIVLNETKYTLFADPKYIKDAEKSAGKVQSIIGGNTADITKKLQTKDTRYVVLAKKLNADQKKRLDALELKGIGTRDAQYRTYPQGSLASQILGFVNDENQGKYGLEQALNSSLQGKPGLLKAITDVQGVPLATNKDNVLVEPRPGKRVVLTIDIAMQQQLEDILQRGLARAKSKSGSALILDANTGSVRAMANFPTYNPSEYFKVEDASAFTNAAIAAPLEVGSIMKPLTAAAAMDLGVVNRNTTYYDPSFFKIGDATVTNIEEDGGAATRSVQDILQLSLNTGATWLLMQMGGGEINAQARTRWHEYMVNHYQLGKLTGIEQGYEAEGHIPDPIKGFGLNIQYANAAFGQGMTATPLQMGAAMASVINGGTYYKPHLIEGQTKVVRDNVVKDDVGQAIVDFMEFTVEKNNKPAIRAGYSVGGKTGTAEIPKPGGGYYEDRFNGMYLGFVGGDTPQYVIVVRVNEPHIAGYAGAQAAAPIFADLSNMLINSFGVSPKS